jgi:enterochelin esterase family protein
MRSDSLHGWGSPGWTRATAAYAASKALMLGTEPMSRLAISAPSRHVRDVLLAKGYEVAYREFPGGHDYFWWIESLAEGLIALLGDRARGSSPED